MRNMSFQMTKRQVLDRTKTVTRRIGWANLQPGQLLRAVEKGMGLKAGEKAVALATIRVVSVRTEPLHAMTDDVDYGVAECEREGFGDHPTLRWPSQFVEYFCGAHRGCAPATGVQRIEFEYVD